MPNLKIREAVIQLCNVKDRNVQFALLLNRIRNCNKERIQRLALFTSHWPFLVSCIFMFLSFLLYLLLFFISCSSSKRFQHQRYSSDVCLSVCLSSVCLSVLLESQLRTEESKELYLTEVSLIWEEIK